MGKVIQFEELPPLAQGSNRRKMNNCNHRRLLFTLLTKTVECRTCGKQWRDFLWEAKK